MTDPRRLVPRQSHTVCRRTRSRTLFLNPSPFVNQVVLYCLGLAQERHGIAIHAATFESTHYHLGVTDAEGRSSLSDFEHDLNENVARALNAHYDRSENLWSKPGSYGNTEVHTLPDQEEQLCYVWAQVVKDGLVPTPEAWEGVRFLPEDFGKTLVIPRPEGAFFGRCAPKGSEPTYGPAREERRRRLRRLRQEAQRRLNARDRARDPSRRRRRRRKDKQRAPRPVRQRSTLPKEVKLTITPPPGYERMSQEEVRAHFRRRLDAYLAKVMAEREEEGLTSFKGMAKIKAQDARDCPDETSPSFARNPRIACKDPKLRVELLDGLVDFRFRVHCALRRWCAGERDAKFPYGTYWMVRFHGAQCERAPPR